jgi:hypothetical protein
MKNICVSYDPHGNRYDIPSFIVNEPVRYGIDASTPTKSIAKKAVAVKFRVPSATTDIDLQITTN